METTLRLAAAVKAARAAESAWQSALERHFGQRARYERESCRREHHPVELLRLEAAHWAAEREVRLALAACDGAALAASIANRVNA